MPLAMRFVVVGPILDEETIARGRGIRELARLRKHYGRGSWRKRKGSLGSDLKMARPARRSSTGTKRMASGAKSTKSSASSRNGTLARTRRRHVVCVANSGYPASLELRKIYVSLVDATAERSGFLRVVDESGEDYLYPKDFFAEIKVPPKLAKALATSA